MKQLMILLVVLMVTSVSYGENGPSPLVTPGSVSGLGTMAVVDSPVPVANGGTGATTAAAGLTALGGASLNGSSTVDFSGSSFTATARLLSGGDLLVGTSTVLIGLFGDATASINNSAAPAELVLNGTDRYSTLVLQANNVTGFSMGYDGYTGKTSISSSLGKILSLGVNFVDTIKITGTQINLNGVLEFADNAAAVTGGLVAGDVYHTSGVLKVVTP